MVKEERASVVSRRVGKADKKEPGRLLGAPPPKKAKAKADGPTPCSAWRI